MLQTPGASATDGVGARLSRRDALRRLGLLGLGLTSAGALAAACSDGGSSGAGAPPRTRRRPNMLLFIADDMRYDQLEYLPNIRRLIAEPGRTFTQSRCNVPLCQPSRVGLFTGQASRHSGEVFVGFGGSALTDHDNCLGNWMHQAGYRCGYFGKYVNWYDGGVIGGIDAPAGYSVWRETLGEGDGYNYRVHENTGVKSVRGVYGTDYLAKEASAFLAGSEPFMCIVSTTQAHTPFQPPKQLAHKFASLQWHIVEEGDMSDKPPWMQALPPLTAKERAQIREDARGSLRELTAVDEMVESILGGLDRDVLDNTVVLFTSDNGVHRGEHRRHGSSDKASPYEVALRVPLLARGPAFPAGRDIAVPSLSTQDITATMLALGGAQAGLPNQAGTSLAAIAADPAKYESRVLLHEIGQGFVEMETADGITTGPRHPLGFRKLFRYPSIRTNASGPFVYEAYDLDTDPDEQQSWADDPQRRDDRNALEAQLNALLAS
jgi:arylsulfatase A-like enzyme